MGVLRTYRDHALNPRGLLVRDLHADGFLSLGVGTISMRPFRI